MNQNIRAGVFILALLPFAISIGCTRASPPQDGKANPSPTAESYPTLTARTQEICDALAKKDYLKVIELTHPKVIETGGGREKMMATMQNELKGMEKEGVAFLSITPGSPTNFVHDAGSIYAVIPITSKMKAQAGVYQIESTLVGISSDAGANWTFIDAAGEDEKILRMLLPSTLDKLKLPPEKPPVKISG